MEKFSNEELLKLVGKLAVAARHLLNDPVKLMGMNLISLEQTLEDYDNAIMHNANCD